MKKLITYLGCFISLGLFGQVTEFSGDTVRNSKAIEILEDNDQYLESGGAFDYTDSTASLRYIDFDLTDGWSMQEGRVGWDADDKTLEVGLDQGSIIQIGQEVVMRATNKTGSDISDGDVVYVSGAQGNRPTIALASDTSLTAILTLGVCTQDIDNNDIGYVTLIGLVRGYNTSGFSAGDVLWLGTTPGTLVNTRPSAPNHAVTLGVALNSAEDGLIAVRPVVVQRAAWLSDVNDRDNQPHNGIFVWDSINGYYNSVDSINVNAIEYTDTYWDDLRVPLTNTRINPALSEPDFEDAGKGFYAWGFDPDNDSINVLHFIAQLPHSYKEGTDIEAHIHWTPPTTNTGVVRWKVTYYHAPINGTITDAASLWVNDAGDGTAHKHQLADFGTIDGSTLALSGMIMGYVTRLGDHADDTFTGSAYGLELDFHYQIDAPGSPHEYIK